MKRSHRRQLISLSLLAILLVDPLSIALALNAGKAVSAQSAVTASAVVVPAQITELGFLVSGLAGEISVSEGDEVQAGQTLMVVNVPELEFAVAAAEEGLRAAQAEVKIQSYRRIKVRRGGRVFLEVVPSEVRQLASARAQEAQVALEIAQANLAQGTLIAPHDGTVVSIQVIPGEFVRRNEAVVTLASLDHLQIETTDLSELDITKVRLGGSADVFVEALNAHLHGQVIAVSPIANVVGGDVVFKVTIALDEQPKGLLWGMTAEVNISE